MRACGGGIDRRRSHLIQAEPSVATTRSKLSTEFVSACAADANPKNTPICSGYAGSTDARLAEQDTEGNFDAPRLVEDASVEAGLHWLEITSVGRPRGEKVCIAG